MDNLCYLCCFWHAFLSVHCCLVVTRCERAELWLLFIMSNCDFATFPCGNPGQVWYLIVLIPDLCGPFYFDLDQLAFKAS